MIKENMLSPSAIHTTRSAPETKTLGQTFAMTLSPGTLVTFQGDLGAGKTTFIQGLLAGLGALPPYPSPTFVLMNEYELPTPTATGIRRVYHADAYRVTAADFEKLGFAEWCADPAGLVLLEWPERLADILPEPRTEVMLEHRSATEREISIRVGGGVY
jgi:tRNA threonylcarbamoyl adenosine modification protein YjeE